MQKTVTLSTRSTPCLPQLEKIIAAAWQYEYYRQLWGYDNLDDVLALVRTGRFSELPVIRKQHLRDSRAQIVNFDQAVDVVSSSGTTGRPVDIPVHAAEEKTRVLRVRRVLRELGIGPGSRVLQLLSLNDLFTLGPLVRQAIKAEGGCAIRCSPQRLDRVLLAIESVRPQFVVGNPFTLTRMVEEAGARWPDRSQLPDRAFLCVAATFDAQLHPTPVAQAVADTWGLEFWLNQYGSSEIGPIAFECGEHQGLHVHDDFHYVELVDPETGHPVTAPDQPGEVVLTGLTTERGLLPVRYAMGDVAAWLRTEPCTCGRTSPRLGPILGRVDHQLKVYGQTVFPDLLLDLADQSDAVHRSAVRVQYDPLNADEVTLLLVPRPDCDAERIRQEVAARLAQNLAVSPSVELTSLDELHRLEQMASSNSNMVKIPRFFDLRKENA